MAGHGIVGEQMEPLRIAGLTEIVDGKKGTEKE